MSTKYFNNQGRSVNASGENNLYNATLIFGRVEGTVFKSPTGCTRLTLSRWMRVGGACVLLTQGQGCHTWGCALFSRSFKMQVQSVTTKPMSGYKTTLHLSDWLIIYALITLKCTCAQESSPFKLLTRVICWHRCVKPLEITHAIRECHNRQ